MTIRNLDKNKMSLLRLRAGEYGSSLKEEENKIPPSMPTAKLKISTGALLIKAIRIRVEPLGGLEFELPPRTPMREPPDFGS